MPLNRREFLASAVTAAIFPVSGLRAQTEQLKPDSDGFFRLEPTAGEARLRGADQPVTPVLGYNGKMPAPVLRIRKGEELKVKLVNSLKQSTSLHIRGMRGPSSFDGVVPLTQQALAPGQTQDIRFVPPDSGTFYFHPHCPGSAEQAGRGLGGVLIVEEEKPPAADHEFILFFADWRFDGKETGAASIITMTDSAKAGRLGETLTINGGPVPFAQEAAPGARIRLRIVNACMAQLAALTFEGVTPMIAAIDSQPCNVFEPVNKTFPIGPGARFDLFFDMPDSEKQTAKIIFRRWPIEGIPETPPQDFAIFTAKGMRRAALPAIASLPDNTALTPVIPLQNARRMELTIAPSAARGLHPERLWTFNGSPMNVADRKPLFSIKRGTPVSLGFINTSRVPHVMRVHGHVMRQLHLLDDGWEPYWRDSVIVPEGKTVRVAFLADNPGKWRIGSGILAHAESGLSTWFEVT